MSYKTVSSMSHGSRITCSEKNQSIEAGAEARGKELELGIGLALFAVINHGFLQGRWLNNI